MIAWYLQEPNRYATEVAALRAAETSSDWLMIDAIRVDSEMRICVDLLIKANANEWAAVLRYPQTFPFTPPTVSPRDPERWSGHQYGWDELCLEWGPDNWRPELTGADMVRSAYRLLTSEAPREGDAPAVAPSRHRITQGQELRAEWGRLLITQAMAEKLAEVPRGEEVKVKLVDLDREDTWVLVPARMTSRDGADWENPDVPSLTKFAQTWEVQGFGLPAGVTLPAKLTASALRAFLSLHGLTTPAANEASVIELVFLWSDEGATVIWLRRDKDLTFVFAPISMSARRRHDPEHAGLAAVSIGIVGCGALGSKLATSMARAGVRRFVLIDDDILLPENLVRNDLDWTSIGEHKAVALARRLRFVAPETTAMVRRQRLGAQEASGGVDWMLSRLQECDLIVDATASPDAFNLLSSIATAAGKPMVWAEVFGGGFGGLIARSRSGVDPTPQEARARIEAWCAEQGVPAPRPIGGYEVDAEDIPWVADDADVSVIAASAARYCIDLLLQREPSHFPTSAYLIGLRQSWLFSQPFHTIPIDLNQPLPSAPAEPTSPEAIAMLLQLFSVKPDATSPAT